MKWKLHMFFGRAEDESPIVKHKVTATEDFDLEMAIAEFERQVFDVIEELEDATADES